MYRFVLSSALVVLFGSVATAEEKLVLRVAIPKSAFRDVPAPLLTFATQPFRDLIKTQTGFDGQVLSDAEALPLARDIDAGKIHLGVFLGHEFAWAQQKYPDLMPVVCSVPKPKEIQAFVLVRHDQKGTSLSDMKGTRLIVAAGLRDHARLFLDKKQAEDMTSGGFCSTSKAATVQDALYKVIESEADVTVADQAAWRYFQKLYPGASQNLRVLAQSDVFPPTVIACKKGKLTDEQLKKVKDGLMTAHQSKQGGRLMGMIKLEKFDELPTGYMDSIKSCLKLYPVPPSDLASDK